MLLSRLTSTHIVISLGLRHPEKYLTVKTYRIYRVGAKEESVLNISCETVALNSLIKFS